MAERRQSGRDLALETLKRVATQGAFAAPTLRALFAQADLPPVERALATELVNGVLRTRGHLDRALRKASGKRVKDLDPALHDVLRLGAYQLLELDRVPAFAAVDTAVEQAKRRKGKPGAATVNAILRKLADSPEEARIPPPAPERDPVQHLMDVGSLSRPIAEVLLADLGLERARAFALASLERAPLTLRANLLRTTAEAIAERIGGRIGALPYAIRTDGTRTLPSELDVVIEGLATPQDEASMRVVELLDPRPGERVLDVCAAPGGKTTHAAERMLDQGTVVAHDRLPARLARVAANAARLGLGSITTTDVLPVETFDRVLVDAPCSGLGTLRRHPEIRWRFRTADLDELAKVQAEVLAAGAARVGAGGVLVYSVCTVTRAEGEAQLAALGGFEVETMLRTGPDEEGAPDGFFAARLRKHP